MKGFIFAAGFGERLRPITDGMPKPLVPVVNIPAICYALALLRRSGIDEIIINLHYRAHDIVRFFAAHDDFGCRLFFSFEEEILGTGGGLKNCERQIDGDECVILNSDVIMDLDVAALVDAHRRTGDPATVVLHRTPRASEIGMVGVDGDRVIDFKNFLESGARSDYIYSGAAVVSSRLFPYLVPEFSSIVYTGYVELIRNARLGYVAHESCWLDIGSLRSFREANLHMLEDRDGVRSLMCHELGLPQDAISRDARIRDRAVVRNSVIGDGAVLGEGALVENSVVLSGGVIAANARIVDSVVFGDRVLTA
ncbi:MAG TPA: NDP-sugar synthase [Spirochaetota bacterium]|nr:NDP-sugar synthase [Spirochaetota bacterium]HNT12079.1 NDP-sugar synthase [Spirochaetota bacterium]